MTETKTKVCATHVTDHNAGRFTQTRPCKNKVTLTFTFTNDDGTPRKTEHYCSRHSVYVAQYLRAGGTGYES